MSKRRLAVLFLLYALTLPTLVTAQQPAGTAPTGPAVDANDPIERIRSEEKNNSQVMQTLDYLTNVIGQRLTASPGMKRANDWTRDKLAGWGLENSHLEAWGPFGRGWSLKRFSAQIVEPQAIPLVAYPKAWSPPIRVVVSGPAPPVDAKSKAKNPQAAVVPASEITADVVYLNAKVDSDLDKYEGQLKGKIVLFSPLRELETSFEPLATRLNEKDLLELANAPDPALRTRPRGRMTPERIKSFLDQARFAAKRFNLLVEEGAAVAVDVSRAGSGGTLFVQGASVAQTIPETIDDLIGGRNRRSPYDAKSESLMIPQITVAAEHYNRMVRMILQGEKLRMTVNLEVEYQDADPMGYNTIAEIPGTDLKDEVVMLGGHMDSWHAGTGATDNGAGVAVAMEVVRIIKALGLKPRRTIRVALWTGEEQGLFGSEAYVKQHFGEVDGVPQSFLAAMMGNGTPAKVKAKPDYEKFSAYFNLDNGTGKIRGIYLQGNGAVRELFAKWLLPFTDDGAATITISNTGGTDHQSFDAIGLPGFQFIQDEIDYDTRTHHSNQDVYDRIQAADMKQASTIMAAFVFNAAMLDQKLPRKPVTLTQ